ncbi:PhzF family phenazine biosynthesis protein [Paenibacillus caseinilyticus]|uniref:Phenazine biosynthesis protein PhzF family n=1 Tax=Paenibacillus mucilaginosus K02 TaxID=997761 RepID=I0BG15_9BACL|nr:PhzF family phenazine biosynthesis protein [Paenibacillus mucilaginosus]AFH61312.1 phenazine biosynthesis protein PhzF family [Paenibacillus mucilaginosus K02]
MMKQIRVYHVDAFTQNPFEGNPAGVVPDASDLTLTQMQKIANELNLPETAFLLPPTDPKADFRVRYFTPQEEINFCGHATVASVWLLANEYGWAQRADHITLETNIGLIPVHWDQGETKVSKVTMTQISPQVKEAPFHDRLEIANLIGVDVDQLDERFPIKLAYTGNWTLIVPVKTHQAIDLAQPKMDQLAMFNKKYSISNTHLFTFDAKQGFDLYTRDFAPAIGIPEDPVTGAANGALTGYLVLENIISKEKTHLTIGQGDALGRPGTLYVTIKTTETDMLIQVGGFAHVTLEGNLRLPER